MVVDDSEIVLAVAKKQLTNAGFDVITRSVPTGTHMAILHDRPDLVLTDLSMPMMSGVEIVRAVREHPSLTHTAIYIHSARPAEELQRLADEIGADGYILKQATPGEFVLSVRRALSRRPTAGD